MLDKKQMLQDELQRYEKKITQLKIDWSESRDGSRYGDEYGEIQIKVYTKMIEGIKNDLKSVN